MRGKIRRLEEALECSFFTDEHAAVLAMMLVTIDHCTTQIQALTQKIDKLARAGALGAPFVEGALRDPQFCADLGDG
jgi:transposase